MRAYITFLSSGALTLVGLGATILVQGGWQAAAAGFTIFVGIVFASSFIGLSAATERPRPRRAVLAVAGGRQGGVPATTDAERAQAKVGGERADRAPRGVTAYG